MDSIEDKEKNSTKIMKFEYLLKFTHIVCVLLLLLLYVVRKKERKILQKRVILLNKKNHLHIVLVRLKIENFSNFGKKKKINKNYVNLVTCQKCKFYYSIESSLSIHLK